jgi:hypothetical protein
VILQGVRGFKSLRLRLVRPPPGAINAPRGEPARKAPPVWMTAILGRAALGGGLGVPCTGNPRYAGLMLHLRLVYDRAAPGEQC